MLRLRARKIPSSVFASKINIIKKCWSEAAVLMNCPEYGIGTIYPSIYFESGDMAHKHTLELGIFLTRLWDSRIQMVAHWRLLGMTSNTRVYIWNCIGLTLHTCWLIRLLYINTAWGEANVGFAVLPSFGIRSPRDVVWTLNRNNGQRTTFDKCFNASVENALWGPYLG